MQIDKVLETHVGSLGRYQKLLVAMLSIPGLIGCIFTMEILFTAGKMDHWCDIPQPPEGPLSNLTRDDWLGIVIPTKYEEGKPKRDKCTAYNSNVSYIGGNDSLVNTTTSQCSKYEYDTSVFKTTIVNEWNLVCSKRYIVSLIKSFIMVGKGFGYVIGGIVSDKLGRKRALCLAIVLCVISRIGIIFAPNLVAFIIFNSLTVFGTVTLYLAGFTLSLELVGLKWRGFVGGLTAETYALGYLLLALIAYFCRERTTLHIVTTMGLIILVPVLWLVPESPRWLSVKGRQKQAIQVLDVLARRNGSKLPADVEIENIHEDKEEKKEPSRQLLAQVSRNKRPILLRVFVLVPAWFTANMSYYSLTMNIQSFAGSLYVNLAIAGALEFVGAFFGQFIISTRLGRRLPTSILYLLSGASLLLILAIPRDKALAATVLAVLGRTCCSSYFTTIYIWTAELFPSTMRSSALSVSSFAGKVGGVIAPFLVELEMVAGWLPMAILGGLSILSGCLMLALPETKSSPLPQTLDDLSPKRSADETNI